MHAVISSGQRGWTGGQTPVGPLMPRGVDLRACTGRPSRRRAVVLPPPQVTLPQSFLCIVYRQSWVLGDEHPQARCHTVTRTGLR